MSTFDESKVARHPGGRSDGRGGQFADKPQSAPEVSLTAPDLSSWTPTEVDTDTAEAMRELMRLDHRAETARRTIRSMFRRKEPSDLLNEPIPDGMIDYNRRYIERARAELRELEEQIRPVRERIQRNEAEYARRPWPRAFLVPQGHAHSSTACSTCYPTTVFYLLPEYSGKNEEEIVAAAGSRACTVCYPSAPVDVLNRPSEMLTPDEREAVAAREERAKAKAEREAKKAAKAISTPSGEPLRYHVTVSENYVSTVRIDTEFSAWQELTKLEEYYGADMRAGRWLDSRRGNIDEYIAGRDLIIEALMHKTGKTRDEVVSEVERRVKNRAKRG